MTFYIYNIYKDFILDIQDTFEKIFECGLLEVFYINPIIDIDTPPPRNK